VTATSAFDQNGEKIESVFCRGQKEIYDGARVAIRITAAAGETGKNPTGEIIEHLPESDYQAALRDHWAFTLAERQRELEALLRDQYRAERAVLDGRAAALDRQEQDMATRVQLAEAEAAKRKQELEERAAAIDATVAAKIDAQVGELLKELASREDEIHRQERALDSREGRCSAVEHQIERFHAEGGPTFMRLLRGDTDQEDHPLHPMIDKLPPTWVDDLQTSLARYGYQVSPAVVRHCVLSTAVAAATGQFVVLTGPPGVGKSTLVGKLAWLLGAGHASIAVRPGWLDATDLLGFYNATEGRYHPTPFLDALVEAREHSQVGRPYFLMLDEMNLARIENYASDLLAMLERVHGDDRSIAELRLYSSALERDRQRALLAKRREIEVRAAADHDDARRTVDHLQQQIVDVAEEMRSFPARFPIPAGLVVFGTMNLDETTHYPSPKFLDRSLVLHVPSSGLPSDMLIGGPPPSRDPLWTLAADALVRLVRDAPPPNDHVRARWTDLRQWERTFLEPLGVPLSHRFQRAFVAYMSAATTIGRPEVLDEAFADFVCAKCLPWIRFHITERAAGGDTKLSVLKRWEEDGSLESFPTLQKEIGRMTSRGGSIVQYWE
jgi:energy-coupling factor transporter ATP-binding protein EcfA2